MLEKNVHRILEMLSDDDRVLDVGGWACPFNRADWILDVEPYETRGFYEKVGLPKSQAGERERFAKATWVQRDICDRKPWPFADKEFDFVICSHTLEDVRDPLFVCSELSRVAKRGYIETPSRLEESCLGSGDIDRMVGYSHHRWFVENKGSHVVFTQKYHTIHALPELHFPKSFWDSLTEDERHNWFFWEGGLTCEELVLHGQDEYDNLKSFANRVREARGLPLV